jgi:hypothetical protein
VTTAIIYLVGSSIIFRWNYLMVDFSSFLISSFFMVVVVIWIPVIVAAITSAPAGKFGAQATSLVKLARLENYWVRPWVGVGWGVGA